MDNAIVAGANGFVGSAVVNHLKNQGIQVLSLGRKLFPSTPILSPYLSCNLNQMADIEKKFRDLRWSRDGNTVFYNFAWTGDKGLTDGSLEQQLENVERSVNAVKLANILGCSKFINCGSQEESILEGILKNPLLPFKLTQINYAIAKLAARDYCRYTSYELKLDYVHTRMSVPFSRNFLKENYIEAKIRDILAGRAFEAPTNTNVFDLVFIEDVAEAYLKLGLAGHNQSDYFIGSGSPSTLEGYFSSAKFILEENRIPNFSKIVSQEVGIFDITLITTDTGYTPSIDFINFFKKYIDQ